MGVRFFGLSRGAFRYVERLSSHSLAFAALKKFRLRMYKFLEPLVPYKLPKFMTEAELLSRICQDVEEKEAWLPRAGVPLFACAASVTVSVFVLAYFHLHYANETFLRRQMLRNAN
ncbi:hypothetical protein AGMMS49938_19050 [Fibrobacterales bacterium]|nr:hypothetical protein AGMMS49938_19050 [Fibrobacterales bacterium]